MDRQMVQRRNIPLWNPGRRSVMLRSLAFSWADMIGKILISLIVLIVGVASVGMIVPDEARVERSIVIQAPKERLYALVSDFHNWRQWSPFTGAVDIVGEGVGQTLRWADASPPLVSGEQVVSRLAPGERIDTVLRYRPMRAGEASLALSQTADGVRAVWSFETHLRKDVAAWRQPFAAYEALILRRQIGAAYAQGLKNLKRVAEAAPAE